MLPANEWYRILAFIGAGMIVWSFLEDVRDIRNCLREIRDLLKSKP